MKKRTYTVYKHTAPNGKVYIGITSLKPSIRYGKGGENYSGCPLFFRAIKKYGWKNIKHEIIETGLEKHCAEKMEVKLISEYKSSDRRFGYNISLGGGALGGHSDETKKKISESLKGEKNPFYGKNHPPEIMGKIIKANKNQKRSDEFKRLRSQRYRGSGNPNYGKPASEKTKAIWSEQRSGRKLTEEWKKKISDSSTSAKSVICIETGEVFQSCVKAAIAKGIKTPRNIGDACRGVIKTCGGFHWEFAEGNL